MFPNSIFFDQREYFEISVVEISGDDCILYLPQNHFVCLAAAPLMMPESSFCDPALIWLKPAIKILLSLT